jgi:superfamily II DNA or RNA helicase
MARRKIKATIHGRVARLYGRRFKYEKLEPFFSFTKPGAKFSPAFRYRGWDGKIRLLRRDGIVSASLLRAQAKEIKEKTGISFKITSEETKPIFFHKSDSKSDRIYQNECVDAMLQACSTGGGLILSATGSGKTYVAGLFLRRLSGNAVFIVNELTLLKQARKEISKIIGEKVGIVGEGKFKPRRVTIATVQTVHKHRHSPKFRSWVRGLDVVMIDEFHEAMNKSNFQTVAAIQPAVVFGFTATLSLRKKHVRLKAYALAGPIVYEYPLKKGQDEGYLAYGVAMQIPYKNWHEPGRGMMAYVKEYKRLIAEEHGRHRLVKALAKEGYKRKKYMVILVERVNHLHTLSKMLENYPHALAYGAVNAATRFRVKTQFDKGKIRLVIANKVFQKGIDIKRIDTIIDASGMKSQENVVQKFGRGTRKFDNKKGLVFFDIADVGNRFEKNAKSRKRALKRIGVTCITFQEKTSHKKWARQAYDNAEQTLSNITKRSEQSSQVRVERYRQLASELIRWIKTEGPDGLRSYVAKRSIRK